MRSANPSTPRNDRGSALVMAVFVLALLTGMGTALLFLSQHEAKMSQVNLRAKKAFFVAEAGLENGRVTLFNVNGTWRPSERVTATARLRHFSSTELIHPRGESVTSFPQVWLVDLNTTVRDVFPWGVNLDDRLRTS